VVVGTVLDHLAETILDALAQGNEITLPGVCKFDTGWRGPRKGTNPRTGEAIQIGSKWVPKIKALKALRDAIEQFPPDESSQTP